jgi:metal-responsive CopG/Arc/MetJ family transcriptional regulator
MQIMRGVIMVVLTHGLHMEIKHMEPMVLHGLHMEISHMEQIAIVDRVRHVRLTEPRHTVTKTF